MPVEQRSNTPIMRRPSISETNSMSPEGADENKMNDIGHDENSEAMNSSEEMADYSPYKHESFNSRQKSLSQHGPSTNSRFEQNNKESITPKESLLISPLLWVLVSVALAFVIYRFVPREDYCSFEKLEEISKQDANIWNTLSSGIYNIKKKRSKQPCVYLFVSEDGNKMQGIVKEIATRTNKCFDNELQLIEMTEEDFTSPSAIEDYGNAIEKFKEKIIKGGRVALIVNLNGIPAVSARALHTICDTYSPVADDIIIYLTLIVPPTMDKPVQIARDTLTDLWGSKLKSHELDPLITRITDVVLPLK